MVNTQLLDEYISKSGLKINFICEHLGLTAQGFKKKRNGSQPFKAAEVHVLCELCHIPDDRVGEIFLP